MLEIRGLSKSFGDYQAVDDFSLSIKDGEILGLIGQNGAGKTTTFRLILNFLTKDAGVILWNEEPLTSREYNIIGYLPEERGLYLKDTIESQLYYFASLRGKNKAEISPMIDFWMEKFQVKGKRTDKVKKLSKGNQQKVQLIATLIHQPKLVILDEPFSGLDPVNADLLKTAVKELRQTGTCVIFSDHNMNNVEEMVDTMVMMRAGKKILDGTVYDVRQSYGRTRLLVETTHSKEELLAIEGVEEVTHLQHAQYRCILQDEEAGKRVFDFITQNGYVPVFHQEPPTLEEIFKMEAGEINEK
jgi:ABC-2 type transport system ATP-binding protein